MIVVVEGPSAVGKTSLTCQLPPQQVISEDWAALGFPPEIWPDLHTPEGQAFGITMVSQRWKLLCQVERQFGRAYADTDPLKLYYNFALALHGSLSRDQLRMTFALYRQAIVEEQLGFADAVIFLRAAPATLWSRKNQDTRRRRGKFDLHIQLIDAFAYYYATLEQIRPGTVTFHETDEHEIASTTLVQAAERSQRYAHHDLHAFDALQYQLLQYLDSANL